MNSKTGSRLIASILCANMFLMNTPFGVLASEISGYNQTSGTYNIEAAKVSGSTGFRHYEKFNLSRNDVANLVYKDYSKFVNLVNQQIEINGLVQTMKDGSFYNGHAIFVSPNGMVIGASGVLNVGSLSVLTPSLSKYNDFKSSYESGNLSSYEYDAASYKGLISDSQGNIIINGKILARDEVNLYGSDIKIGDGSNRAGIIAGANNGSAYESADSARAAFDSLVSNNITDTNGFSLSDGKIQIVANSESGFIDEGGDVTSKVEIKKADLGANKIDISSKAEVDRQERIDLASAKIDVEDSTLTGDTISIIAEANQKKEFDIANPIDDGQFVISILDDIFDGDAPNVTSLWGVAGKAVADVTIKNSTINALKATSSDAENPDLSVLIHAEASSDTSENANFLTPAIIDLIKNDEAHISEYFSTGTYNGFEGARSSATVTFEKSTINANASDAKNVEISTAASSNLDANNRVLAFMMPIGMYATGTETVSKAIVKGSTLNVTKGDVDVVAVSTNENAVNLTNESLVNILVEDEQLYMLLNNTNKTETDALIIAADDGTKSVVNSKNLTVLATNLSNIESEVGMTSKANKNGATTGNTGISVVGILNRSDNKVTAKIADSNITTQEDTSVIAQSLNVTKNTAEAAISDQGTSAPKTFDQNTKKKLKDIQKKYLNKNIFDMIKGRNDMVPEQSASLEAGGALVWSNTNNTTNAIIENSDVKAADAKVQANTVDLVVNSTDSDASDTNGEGNNGIGIAVIVNQENNTSHANIKNSTVSADSVFVDATTEIPMNQGKLTFGIKLPFKICGEENLQFGTKFSSEANGKWDLSFVRPNPTLEGNEPKFEVTGLAEQSITSTYSGLKPKLRFGGLFNNFAHSESKGDTVGVSGAVVYNDVVNNTTAEITDGSTITIKSAKEDDAQGNLVVNAVNSVIGYNAAGMVEFLIGLINNQIPGQPDDGYVPNAEAGTFGLGTNFLWNNYTNNATAKIDNSSVSAEKGDVNVNSATEQSYITLIMTGGKSSAVGIDGSISVQKIKGDTLAVISNVDGENSISANNISINAGKAQIRTTGGKVERYDESNLAKWKVQDSSAEGDDKYVRDAKDAITNIIAQGGWSSQDKTIHNTVQTSSFGISVGTSVGVSDVDRSVKAKIENSKVTSTGDTTVNAETYNQKVDVEVAAAFSGGVSQEENDDVQNAVNNAQDPQDAEDDNIFGNLFDNEDEYMRNPVGNALAAIQGQFNLSLAGAVDVSTDNTKVEALISNNSTIDAGGTLTLNADRESKNVNIGGGLGKSRKVGAGAAVNYYKQEGHVKSFIDGSTVTFSGDSPELKIDANNKNWILDIAIGAGIATSAAEQDAGFESAIGGSASFNTLKPNIEAYINGSTISIAQDGSGNIKTTINAKNDIDVYNIAGGGTYLSGATSGLSAGAAVNYNNVKNTISTYIKDSTLNDIGKLTMLSDADNNLNSFAVAGSIVTGTQGFSLAFDGSVDVDYVHDTISSKVINSTITAADDIEVKANSKSENLAVAGSIDFTTAQSGAGVNGDVVVNVFRNNITAEIDKNSNILKSKDINVSATSTEKSNVIPVGASVATNSQFLMAAANVGINVIDNSVKAHVSGNIGVDIEDDEATNINNLKVVAFDETTLYSRGGTLALASADSIANIAGSVNVDKINKTVEAKIIDADIKSAGEVEVLANSINSLGGTPNSQGEYTRDDVTTDAYKEKMLKKNDDGEYDDLKLGNSFQNWNMFYNLSAGAHLSASGAGIGKVIENNIRAEINNSKITADDLSILAKDYSVKNIIAGSIGASSKAAAGLQAIYTRDNSTTEAIIAGGSNLSIDNKIEMLANNVKDSHEILIAGSGAGNGVINANVVLNNITDKTIAKIDNLSSENVISAEQININSNEDVNQSHIIVTAGGAKGLALSISPTINNYDMTTEAVISNTTIRNSSVDMDAQSKLDTLDISVGVAGVGQGIAGTGIAIKNNYTNTVKSYIDNATINTTKSIDIDANSIINSNNWIASVSVAGQGISIVTNVLLNNVLSTVESGIKNSIIENAGTITINTNKNKKDDIRNKAIGLGATNEGASALVNVVQNIYENTVHSYVDNTSSTAVDALAVNSNSDRYIENINLGLSFAGFGASLLANALVNQIDSTTRSTANVQDKTLNISNALVLDAKDNTTAYNTMGMINGAGAGAAAGANINLYYANNLAVAEVKSSESGQINAGSSNIHSAIVNGLDNSNIGISIGGFGAIAGDVAIIKLGKRTSTYSSGEQESKINDAVNYTKDKYDKITANDADNVKNLYTPTSSPADIKTGAIASVNGNLKTTNDTTIKAESKLKGLGSDEKLTLTNVNVNAGLGVVGVGVKNTQLANNTLAEISGGRIETENGKVSVNAESKSNVEIKNVKVEVSGLTISGGSAIYNNSSETVAQIKDATLNTAGDIDVVSNSISTSKLDSTNVVVTLGGIASVDLAEATDTNKSVALITGNTNIDSIGKLNVHSTVNTDLSSVKSTVTVAGANIVGVSKNEVTANTIGKAIIENVNGTISTNGLDIITDYDKMQVLSKANVTSVKLGDVASIDSSGAYMNADFKSGIDSLTGLIINNTGTTNIITAKDNGNEGIVAKSEINNVHVSLQGFVASTSAKSENTATSTTVLKVKDHNANNLNVNSYLNSSAVSNAGSVKATVGIGVNTVSVDANDTSTLNMNISGDNDITQNAMINATHNSKVNSDMSAFNFSGIIGGGQRIRINSEDNANTTGNIGGDFNANSTNINFNTTRSSVLNKSSGSGGGVINVNDTKATNKLTGSSTLTIDGMTSNTDIGINNLVVKNTSTNTMDVTSSNGSGGLINVSQDKIENEFNTTTTTNINNSDINSDKDVKFEVSNNAIVKDTASMGAGGFVAVADNEANNTYTSNAKLSLNKTTINAENINLKSSADVRNAQNTIVDYAGGAGGFVAENEMRLTNTINQTSEIEIKESKLNATKDIKLNALTSSAFKQRTDTTVGGFVAIPRSKNWLTVTNSNTIAIDALSKLVASDELEVSFDSNNELEARAISEAHHFGFKDPVSESYLTLTINNNLQNNGSLQAGNLVDINFMKDSTNNLTQYAYSEAHAAIPTTTEDGAINKNINNTLNVESGADITSGKDVEISYSVGKGTEDSLIAWKTICYALFGIPISDSGSHRNSHVNHTPILKDNGKIIAGQGNNKYMKINRDGSVDKETLKGFYDDDYILSDGETVSGEIIKQRTLDSIKIEIDNIQESINENNQTIVSINNSLDALNDRKQEVQDKIDEINDLINNGAILTDDTLDGQGNSNFNTIVQNDIKAQIKSRIVDDSDSTKITESQYNTIMTDYDAELSAIETQNRAIAAYNTEHVNEPQEYIEQPTIFEFLNDNNYGLSDEQKQTIADGYDAVKVNLSTATKTGFAVYQNGTNKYVAVSNPSGTGVNQTCKEITDFNTAIENLDKQIEPYEEKKVAILESLAVLNADRIKLQTDYDNTYATNPSEYEQRNGDYSITFNDITPKGAHITVDGAFNHHINGSGIFSVASNGLKIDNYSTRTMVFNDLNIDSAINQSGLIIGGKNHGEFADKNQVVSGIDAYMYINNIIGHKSFENLPTSGVHYKSGGDDISGITINNYYDINHPFASTFNIPKPKTASQIYIIGDINTANELNIWNESGGILIANNTGINASSMSLISTNSSIGFLIYNENNTTPITIKTNDYIFAKDGFAILTNKPVNINGTIETGYSNRSITITEDMIKPENLVYDPTSDETNMIDLGGYNVSPYLNDTNNIKAIYQDGQIYLYNIPDTKQSAGVSLSDTGVTLSGQIKIANGLQNITINNETNAQLNIADISNNQFDGYMTPKNVNIKDDGKITVNTVDHATTNITSNGKLSLNGVITNSITTNYHDFPREKGILNITANNGLEVKQQKILLDNVLTLADSIFAHGKTNITLNDGLGDINGNITTTGELNILNKGSEALNLNGDIKNDASRNVYPETLISEGLINISSENAGILNIKGDIEETEGRINIQNNGQTNISDVSITDEKGDITITSAGLNAMLDSEISTAEGNIEITNNTNALKLYGDIKDQKGNISIKNNGSSSVIGGYIIDEQGDLSIVNTNGDMTISSEISHNYLNQNSEGMISIVNQPAGGKLDIQSAIQTWGTGKTEHNTSTGEDTTTAILIDNQSTTNGLNISNAVSARVGDIIIKNAINDLNVSGMVSNFENGNISITSQGKTSISDTISANEGNIGIKTVGLSTTAASIIRDNKGNITIENVPYYDAVTDTSTYNEMNLAGNIEDSDGNIQIDSYYDAVISGHITDEKGYVIIRNMGGEMTVSGDIDLNRSNNDEEGFISIGSLSSGKKLDITGNIINWGEGHTSQSGTNAINVINSASSSEGVNISGTLSAKMGNIDIENEYGKLTTTSDASISNTEKGSINIINTGKEGAEIRGDILATDGNIGITNTKNNLLINAAITEKKGNINITNTGKALTYLGDTVNESGDTKVVNNGTGIAQIGADINNNGNVTINNNRGENLVFNGEINNFGNTSITNNNGFTHIYGNITNEHGSTIIKNEGEFTEITSKINNDTGSIGISNKNGHLKITDTAEINNTSNRENSNITIVNLGETASGNLMIDGNINSFDKGYIDIVNNGAEANLTGDIFAKDGDIGITNSNAGKLSFTGNIVDYKGDVSILNNSDDGAEIGGTVLDEQGDIEIINNGGDLKVTSEITHNYLNRDAQGMISITNSSNAGKVEIDTAVIATDGAGKTENGKTTAILIDNQSSDYGMSLNSTISARLGDIIIKNANEDLSTAGIISNYEQGNINITNSGKDYTNTANIMNKLGDVNITNNGTGMARIGGSINNQEGSTTIDNNGKDLEVSGTIDNTGGNTTITNDDGLTRIVGDITNKGGNTVITNSGEFTEITSSINNETGSIHISNSKGHLNITDTASITNTTDNSDDSITIANAGDNLNLIGNVKSTNKGDIEITNTGKGKANIEGDVTANEGDIDISNSNTGELNISGSVIDYNGNIDITNDSPDGMTVDSTGKITNVKGNTTITNNKGDLTIKEGALIVNTESGNIVAENKDGKFTIAGLFKHAEIGNVTIKNSGNDELDITSTGQVSVANGNINIQNSNYGAMKIAGNITDGNGKIDIINSSKDGASISGNILDKEGNTTIFNAGGALDISGNVVDNKGDLKLVNNGADGTLISGTVHALDGDTTVYNTAGALDISGYVVDDEGKLGITNTSDKQTTLSGTINAKDGDASIYTNGGLTVTDTGYVVDNKGNMSITNKGGDGTSILGTVLTKEGNATIFNDAGKLDVSGNVVDNKGNLKLVNNGSDGTSISGTVHALDGDTTVYNTAGALDISGYVVDDEGKLDVTNTSDLLTTISGTVNAKDGDTNIYTNGGITVTDTGYVVDDKGNLSITNKGGDGTSILGTVLTKDGDTTIFNDTGKLNISGNVVDNKGDLNITNTGDNGTDISGIVLAKDGKANIHNQSGDFTVSGIVKDESGDINITNNGGVADITGTVLSQNGDIDIYNSNDGALNIIGTVKDENGNINITNDSKDGTNISGTITDGTGDTTITNNDGDLTITETGKVTNTEGGDIKAENNGGKFTIAGLIKHIGDTIGNIFTKNTGNKELEIAETGRVGTSNGNIDINNSNDGAVKVAGFVGSDKGTTDIVNTSKDGIDITTSGVINNKDGNINVSNTGAKGIDIQGSIKADNQDIKITNKDSDIRIGEYESDNDNYINAQNGNVIISQTNGDILNNITDSDNSKAHQNNDLGNSDHAYKTLIAAGNNLVIKAKDGDIGSASHSNPGYSINADTRDYTESINVNVKGNVNAVAQNDKDKDARLVNIRAKESDLNIENVKSDGNVILTAADWKQADKRPTPKNNDYFTGYSINNTAKGDNSAVTGQNISIISSNNIGSADKPFVYTQDTKKNPNSSISIEAENDITITARANSKNDTKINQLISKRGTIDLDLESNGIINEITSGNGLKITQKAQNLTIYNLGAVNEGQSGNNFDDMLYPHDGIAYGDSSSSNAVIPKYVDIKVLDAIDTPERSDSNLKIYSGYVIGNNDNNPTDIKLMADNVYANSYDAPNSNVSTKANPNGYKQTQKTYNTKELGGEDKEYNAKGLNAYGEGAPLTIDVVGVDPDVVKAVVKNPKRNNYDKQKTGTNVPDKFKNDNANKNGSGYTAKNVVVSLNNNVNTNRGVQVGTINADNAYIDTKDTKLSVKDGNINHYAEFRDNDKLAVVDNDYRRLVKPSDIQLYTEKTGSFALDLGETINMHTTAPTVYNNPYELVNGYHSAWNFVNRGFKENKDLIDRIDESEALEKKYDENSKRISMRFDTTADDGLTSDIKIYDISRTGALIRNDKNLKRGKTTKFNIKFDDVDINVKAKVINVIGNKAGVKFINMPNEIANKIIYRYMQQADSMKSNLTTSSLYDL